MGGKAVKMPKAQRPASQRLKSAKATGEPPLCSAAAVVPALRQAIAAFGATDWVALDVPVTVEQVSAACAKAMGHSTGNGVCHANGNGICHANGSGVHHENG